MSACNSLSTAKQLQPRVRQEIDVTDESAQPFSRFLFLLAFVVMNFFLDSPFSYHLFLCYFHHLHQMTPQTNRSFSVDSPQKQRPDSFPHSYPYYEAKGSDNIYMFHYILYHHDKKKKMVCDGVFFFEKKRDQKIWKNI